jgi:ribosomal protein S18 acetylase RimI-like enzyme
VDDRVAGAVTVRAATREDDRALLHVDGVSWGPGTTFPSVLARPRPSFFAPTADPARTLLAEVDGRVVGYVGLTHPTPLPENAHVHAIEGFAVLPNARGWGVGRALLDAAVDAVRSAGGRKLSLRVLGTNTGAQRAYERAGFTVEGVLRGEFLIGGRPVDDVLMARVVGG